MDKGLIKGGSLENAIVIRGEQVLSKEPLRYKEEFVRHKILDIIGDLSLFGRAIKGHVIAVKPGHGPNTELAKAIYKSDGARTSKRNTERRGSFGCDGCDEIAASPLSISHGRSRGQHW
jgi:UDP-3-O-acyl-N-acetylglucosamine deacetylase